MDRRDFITSFSPGAAFKAPQGSPKKRGDMIQSLDEQAGPLSRRQAAHLLRRLTFVPTPEEIDTITGKTAREAVEMILGDGSQAMPEFPEKSWVTTPEENPLTTGSVDIRFEIEGRIKTAYKEFIDWWIGLMRQEGLSSMEKLTLFWSTIWTIEFTYDTLALLPPGLLIRNNQTLRQLRMGNYKEIAEAITLDGAMLMYQSLFYSNRNIANENYMREMMELFTMGTGDVLTGDRNYTEGDIREGTKALTGWRTAAYYGEPHPNGYFETYFSPNDHIIEAKSYMGETIPPRYEMSNTEDLVRKEELREGIIDIMFRNRERSIGRFIANKMYRYFVYSNPDAIDADIIDELADVFIHNEHDVRPMFVKLFASQHFFDEANMGIQFKRPPEFIIGLQKMLNVEYSESRQAIFDLEQVLYDPPNVGSWKGYRTWISTTTFPLRAKYAGEIIDLAGNDKIFALANKFPGSDNIDTFVSSITEYFLPNPIDATRTARYKALILEKSGIDESAWGAELAAENEAVATAIRELIHSFITSPDFQLI